MLSTFFKFIVIYQLGETVSDDKSKRRKESSLDNATRRGVFLTRPRFLGNSKCGQIWPLVFNISFRLKLKVRGKREIKIRYAANTATQCQSFLQLDALFHEFQNFCSIFRCRM